MGHIFHNNTIYPTRAKTTVKSQFWGLKHRFKIVVNINKIISWFFKLLKTFRRILCKSRIIVLTSVIPRRRCLTLKENPEKNSNRIMWNTSVTEPLIKQMILAQTPQPQDCSGEMNNINFKKRLDAFSYRQM